MLRKQVWAFPSGQAVAQQKLVFSEACSTEVFCLLFNIDLLLINSVPWYKIPCPSISSFFMIHHQEASLVLEKLQQTALVP